MKMRPKSKGGLRACTLCSMWRQLAEIKPLSPVKRHVSEMLVSFIMGTNSMVSFPVTLWKEAVWFDSPVVWISDRACKPTTSTCTRFNCVCKTICSLTIASSLSSSRFIGLHFSNRLCAGLKKKLRKRNENQLNLNRNSRYEIKSTFCILTVEWLDSQMTFSNLLGLLLILRLRCRSTVLLWPESGFNWKADVRISKHD